MKYIIALGDGMADEPREDLGGKTPLQYAHTPNMDIIAQRGVCGLCQTVPVGMAPGSDVANMSVLGYAPEKYHTGRAPIEAASMGVKLGKEDIAFRCNFVTIENNTMSSYSAGHIETEDAHAIISELQALNCDSFKFHPGVSYRHLLVITGCGTEMKTVPPHDISGQEISDFLPSGAGSETVLSVMKKAQELLNNSPTNRKRIAEGKLPVTSIWPWGEGTAPVYPSMEERYGITGAVISAVDLVKGLGQLSKMEVINVPGATGLLNTNYAGKVSAAKEALKKHDFVYVHIEAPDECSHEGDINKKLQAIEDFDKKVVGELIKIVESYPEARILCTPDHPTFVRTMTHTGDAVPFALYGKGITPDQSSEYNEISAASTELFIKSGVELFETFIRGGL